MAQKKNSRKSKKTQRTASEDGIRHPGQPTKDDPRQAMEEGEPAVTGRSHGRPVDQPTEEAEETEEAASSSLEVNESDFGEDWESGRQQAK